MLYHYLFVLLNVYIRRNCLNTERHLFVYKLEKFIIIKKKTTQINLLRTTIVECVVLINFKFEGLIYPGFLKPNHVLNDLID